MPPYYHLIIFPKKASCTDIMQKRAKDFPRKRFIPEIKEAIGTKTSIYKVHTKGVYGELLYPSCTPADKDERKEEERRQWQHSGLCSCLT